MYAEESFGTSTRDSPGIFGYLNHFKTRKYTIIFSILFFIGTGFTPFLFLFLENGQLDKWIFLRNGAFFLGLVYIGTISSVFFKSKSPILEFELAFLINLFGGAVFYLSTFLGDIVALSINSKSLNEIFFMIGSIVCYVAMFVIFFSFTTVGRPWYIFLALVQPTIGIIAYSAFAEQISFPFFLKSFIFFMSCAMIYAIFYGPAMNIVSHPYRKEKGIGGYNMVRAFVLSLLTDNNDDQIEYYFQKDARVDNLKIKYLAFRTLDKKKQENQPIKSMFIIPEVHFGPFKTAGSAALADKIYNIFTEIPGTTVFHTTVTHGQNFASNQYNMNACQQIKEDISKFNFETPNICKFNRILHGKSKILGFYNNNTPFMLFTRHPFPTDDIMPEVGEIIKQKAKEMNLNSPFIVDCHNAIVGDEILISEQQEEANEMVEAATQFYSEQVNYKKYSEFLYGCSRIKPNFPIQDGIGSGGIVCHYFKIGTQKTVILNVDANNSLIPVRSQIVNLAENKGLDRIELCTSDTHNVVQVISSRGYHPLGEKIKIEYLIPTIDKLIDEAEQDLELVEISEYSSESPNYLFWSDIGTFDLIIETIQKCLSVSKTLLTIGLAIPAFISLLFVLFFLETAIYF